MGGPMARAMAPGSYFGRALGFLERWPAPVSFVAPGALLARIVQKPLRDVPPDGVAASTLWISPVRSQRRQETRSTWRWISASRRFLIWSPLTPARGSLSTEPQYSAGRGSSGAAAGTAGLRAAWVPASPSVWVSACASQLAGRFGHAELEHNRNDCRARSG